MPQFMPIDLASWLLLAAGVWFAFFALWALIAGAPESHVPSRPSLIALAVVLSLASVCLTWTSFHIVERPGGIGELSRIGESLLNDTIRLHLRWRGDLPFPAGQEERDDPAEPPPLDREI